MPPTPLRNRSSGYATGHPVMHPDRGWASVQNIYTVTVISCVMQLVHYRDFAKRTMLASKEKMR